MNPTTEILIRDRTIENQCKALKHWRDQSDLDAAKLKRYEQACESILEQSRCLLMSVRNEIAGVYSGGRQDKVCASWLVEVLMHFDETLIDTVIKVK